MAHGSLSWAFFMKKFLTFQNKIILKVYIITKKIKKTGGYQTFSGGIPYFIYFYSKSLLRNLPIGYKSIFTTNRSLSVKNVTQHISHVKFITL